jgi:hypothetical protein
MIHPTSDRGKPARDKIKTFFRKIAGMGKTPELFWLTAQFPENIFRAKEIFQKNRSGKIRMLPH